MNQDDVILLGEYLNSFDEDLVPDKYIELVHKCKIVSEQAKASKEYQELMDKLNTELSELGKEVEKDA